VNKELFMNEIFCRIFFLVFLLSPGALLAADINTNHLPFTITAEPNTILPSQVAIGFPVHALYQITNNTSRPAVNASIVSLPQHTSIDPSGCGASSTFTLNPGESCSLKLIVSGDGLLVDSVISGAKAPHVLMVCWSDGVTCAGVNTSNDVLNTVVIPPPSLSYQSLMQDVLINADLWGDTPEVLSANYGFEGIEGVPAYEAAVIAAGGTWEIITTPGASFSAYTTAASPANIAFGWGYPTNHADAIPICFTWPVLPSTVNPTDFRFTLNTGKVVMPEVASIQPNLLYNKRSCVVVFGKFGNRLAPGTPGAVYPVQFSVVDNGTTLMLYGPNGPVSAVGLTIASANPYIPDGGPKLIGGKLSTMSVEGQCAPELFNGNFPNSGVSYYGSQAAQYRLRIYTTAGTSPDGVAAILPSDFSAFFRVDATLNNQTVYLTQTNVPYTVDNGTITVVGLADLGQACSVQNDAYLADRDNYLDIVLSASSPDAVASITAVEIPASGNYKVLYNPGGPGNNPTPGVTYTYPGPYWYQPVTNNLSDPKTVTYNPENIACPVEPSCG